MDYIEFLNEKRITAKSSGFEVNRDRLNPLLFDYQKDIVKWALKKGKAAIWSGTGTGKTNMELEFAKQVHIETGGNTLIVAPLAVAHQTVVEGRKFNYQVNICRKQEDVKTGINITNYEMIEHFDPSKFQAIILDESSILKSFTGKYRTLLIEMFKDTPYKLSASATPSPNDYMEIGNHAEFTGIMTRTEMLSTFFVHDAGDTGKWRLKGHAQDKFWEWIATWAVVLQKPSDLGYSDEGFILPELRIHEIIVESPKDPFVLIPKIAQTLQERRQARRDSLETRVAKVAEIVNSTDEQFVVWCDLNDESKALKNAIDKSVEVRGSDKPEHKIDTAMDFVDGKVENLVSKPSIFGFGMNWQHCNKMVFTGLSDSYEQYYQAIRRIYRYGQKREVDIYIVTSEAEGAVKDNIERKEKDAENMINEMVKHTQKILTEEIHGTTKETIGYYPTEKMKLPEWLKGVA
ncbi:helicase-related protein [Tissierella pigra]|uniref:Helicase n=1 Tax=Tissierella pigra TaxID=2607614 RepID=A0A6N7XZA4_9FIRM|nr:helicase-related protein [Tissierella pigra]MSU01904.1 helicase [Tissierella pigra]